MSSRSSDHGRKIEKLTEKEIALEAKLQALRQQQKDLRSTQPKVSTVSQSTPSNSEYNPGDVLKQEYRFIRTAQDDLEAESSWEKTLAKDYHDKLFKEFALADLSRYKEGKIGLRWRLDREVKSGKGENICGNKKCEVKTGLVAYEVPFSYKEVGENKLALVKVTMCPECAQKLQYRSLHRRVDELEETSTNKKRARENMFHPTDELNESEAKRSKT